MGCHFFILVFVGSVVLEAAADTFVCNSVADACVGYGEVDDETKKRIEILERKVTDLQESQLRTLQGKFLHFFSFVIFVCGFLFIVVVLLDAGSVSVGCFGLLCFSLEDF